MPEGGLISAQVPQCYLSPLQFAALGERFPLFLYPNLSCHSLSMWSLYPLLCWSCSISAQLFFRRNCSMCKCKFPREEVSSGSACHYVGHSILIQPLKNLVTCITVPEYVLWETVVEKWIKTETHKNQTSLHFQRTRAMAMLLKKSNKIRVCKKKCFIHSGDKELLV